MSNFERTVECLPPGQKPRCFAGRRLEPWQEAVNEWVVWIDDHFGREPAFSWCKAYRSAADVQGPAAALRLLHKPDLAADAPD